MSQITHGLRAVLSSPAVYSLFQRIMGAHRGRTRIVEEFVRPIAGMKVLDIGCGPADILDYMADIEYWGYDVSASYIKQASARFGQRGTFYCKELQAADVARLPAFDVVLAIGLLHHLDNVPAAELLSLAKQALKPGGRLITVDPCFDTRQNPLAHFLIKNDRGQNVRNKANYMALASSVFESPHVEVRHQKWIPYTHCFMECTRK